MIKTNETFITKPAIEQVLLFLA
ncbi:hypothetical protein FB2170_17376 [Maribacter sp. HTCC2170]|nr:hypothetical protein FB2170_17376 [Maribacter sp. HTCC2170]